jgi:hypothetical protein
MTRASLRYRSFVVVALAGCGSTSTGVPGTGVNPSLQIAAIEDLGRLPLPSAITLGRDGGDGGGLGGKLLWTFGDTFTSVANPVDGSSVLSATSGWSSTTDPLNLTQPVDGNGFPAQLVPYTAAELAQNHSDPLNGWALWPGAFIDTGEAEGLLIFQRILRSNGSGFDSKGIGTARLAVDATVATRAPTDLFAPPETLFIPGSIVDGEVIAFACTTVGFLNSGCKIARAPRAQADQRVAYEFYDGQIWQGDIARAAVVIDHIGGGLSLSYNPYLHRYLAVNGAVLSSTVLLRTADRVEGPWSTAVEIQPGTNYLAPTDAKNNNYIIIEHPALRSTDGSAIVISYSRPTDPFRGDVRLARITFR